MSHPPERTIHGPSAGSLHKSPIVPMGPLLALLRAPARSTKRLARNTPARRINRVDDMLVGSACASTLQAHQAPPGDAGTTPGSSDRARRDEQNSGDGPSGRSRGRTAQHAERGRPHGRPRDVVCVVGKGGEGRRTARAKGWRRLDGRSLPRRGEVQRRCACARGVGGYQARASHAMRGMRGGEEALAGPAAVRRELEELVV